jgi:hypothetical protein
MVRRLQMVKEYGVDTERQLSTLDLEWVEYVAGRKVSTEEVQTLVREYNEWIEQMEADDVGPEIYAEAA